MIHFSDFGVLGGKLIYAVNKKVTTEPMKAQQELLTMLMEKNKDTEYGRKNNFAKVHSIREYQDIVPLTDYDDYAPYVDREIENGEKNLLTNFKVTRYCASSGSVGKPKLVPKSSKDNRNTYFMGLVAPEGLLAEYLKERGKKVPRLYGPLVLILTGHKLQNGMMSNGAGQVPLLYLKPFSKWFTTSPLEIMYPEHEEQMDTVYLQLRFALPCRDVTFIGSVVITLLSNFFETMEDRWQMLCDDIEKGTIDPSVKCPPEIRVELEKKLKPDPERAAELRREFEKGFETPICPRIWPKLVWGYGMFGSTLTIYVQRARRWLGDDLPMHNMGYAAAEGFFAMPVEMNASDYALLPRSVLFEFLPVDAPEGMRPLLLNELEQGKEYELIITNCSGLYRYRLYDVVKVTGMHNNTPRVEFVYRRNLDMNVANEKSTTQMLDWAVDETMHSLGIRIEGHSYFADTSVTPSRYVLLFEPIGDVTEDQIPSIREALDKNLAIANEKYDKYRRWNTLGDPKIVVLRHGAYQGYKEMLRSRGVVLNQVKPVAVINTKEREEYFFSQEEISG